MTDQELIARLRDRHEVFDLKSDLGWQPSSITKAAADRIEALVKERDDYAHKLMDANNTYTDMHLKIERLSDKLAKAMAGLRKIADHKHFSWDQGCIQNTEARIAKRVLAELEKKK